MYNTLQKKLEFKNIAVPANAHEGHLSWKQAVAGDLWLGGGRGAYLVDG
jgi:hypothetical protein